jgi:membrane protein
MSAFRSLIKQVISQGWKDEVPRMSAALAFYTVFSLAPILIVAIAIAGLVFGQKVALDQVVDQIQQLIGRQSAEAVQAMIEASVKPSSSIMATVIGVITLLVGASGALVELQEGLNRIWKVKTAGGMIYILKQRLTSLAFVAGIAFLLLVSLVISAGLSALGTLISHHVTSREALWQGTDFVLSCFVITALFGMIFKTLPEAFIRWNDVWMGAAVTAVLFTTGKFLMGLYLGKGALTSTYGAAGSFAAVLMWVYYSALVLYFGAEFTKAYADRYGSRRNGATSL